MELERLIETSPAYDGRKEVPNYGQHPLEMHFIVRGPKGALVYTLVTGWYIEGVAKARLSGSGSFMDMRSAPYIRASFHAPATLANSVDQDPHEHCGWLDGPCQAHEPFGSTGKPLGDMFEGFISNGIDWLWEQLEGHYERIANAQVP